MIKTPFSTLGWCLGSHVPSLPRSQQAYMKAAYSPGGFEKVMVLPRVLSGEDLHPTLSYSVDDSFFTRAQGGRGKKERFCPLAGLTS